MHSWRLMETALCTCMASCMQAQGFLSVASNGSPGVMDALACTLLQLLSLLHHDCIETILLLLVRVVLHICVVHPHDIHASLIIASNQHW